MNCNEVAAILDEHRSTRLTAAERSTVDEHLMACEFCSAAWHAQTELLGLRTPSVPAALLERALLAARVPESAQPWRARAPIIVASALLAGAALAAVTIVSVTRSPSVETSRSTDGEPAPTAAEALVDVAVPPENAAPAEQRDRMTSVELVETALSTAPMVRRPPDYPPSALEQRLEGHVRVRFDVTAAGIVESVNVVESSDAIFEESAIRAVSTWRYLPRIAAGKRVAAKDIHTVIRFALAPDTPRPADSLQQPPDSAAIVREYAQFYGDLEIALDRLASDDLRGVELQLDEMQAVYGAERGDLWSFYGYLYTVQGNYGRAIDAYEKAVHPAAQSAFATAGPFLPLANLYFARHQYDMALKTLLRPNFPGGNRVMSPEALALAQKLNALGVTEDTLQ